MNTSSDTLRITEIFYSLQGESHTVGLPTVFIRLTGCPLRCGYCDSAYAFTGGKVMTLNEISQVTASYHPAYVTVTGGEPLAQPNCFPLLSALCDRDYIVSLETSGALDISKVDERVNIVMDIKTPGSGEEAKNHWENINSLRKHHQVKFVICDKNDYDWTKHIIEEHQLEKRCQLLLSPSYGQLANKDLAEWILEDNLPVRFQIQLHKYIWGDIPGK